MKIKIILPLIVFTGFIILVSCSINKSMAVGTYKLRIPNHNVWQSIPLSAEEITAATVVEEGMQVTPSAIYQLIGKESVLFVSSLTLQRKGDRAVLERYASRFNDKWKSVSEVSIDNTRKGLFEIKQLAVNVEGKVIIKLIVTHRDHEDGVVYDALVAVDDIDLVSKEIKDSINAL